MLFERYECLNTIKEEIEKVIDMVVDMYYKGGKLLLCGNGGSCADCDHIVGELMKGFTLQRRLKEEDRNKFKVAYEDGEFMADNLQYGIQAISLPSQTAVNTAFINDVEPSMMYAQLAYAYAQPNDVLIGLSTSGNSKNVVNAVKAAKIKGINSKKDSYKQRDNSNKLTFKEKKELEQKKKEEAEKKAALEKEFSEHSAVLSTKEAEYTRLQLELDKLSESYAQLQEEIKKGSIK